MDYIKRFDIELDRNTYYAGELLTGHVIVENIENIKVQGIRMFIRGKSHCQWKVTRAGEKRTVKEDEYYIDQKTLLWGKNASDEGPVPILPRGLHKLPIEYQIPETNLPCSFESKIGRIRYYIRVVINIPYASHPQGIKYFTVIGPHIDCMDANYLTPTSASDTRKSCCFCLFGGPVVLKVVMERSAYCCGERIKLKAEVQNGCDQKVWLICRLMQHVDYFINRGVLGLRKDHVIKIWEYKSESVQPHQTVNFDQLQDHLQVPVMPPTLLNICSLVNIYYEIAVSLGMERSCEDLDICLPLTIATVPFRIPNTPAPPLQFEFAADNVEGGMYISPEFQLGQVYMGDDCEENDETILYRPVYCAVQHDEIAVTNSNNAPAGGSRSPRLPTHSSNSPRITNRSPIFWRDNTGSVTSESPLRQSAMGDSQTAGCSGIQLETVSVSNQAAETCDSEESRGDTPDSRLPDRSLECIDDRSTNKNISITGVSPEMRDQRTTHELSVRQTIQRSTLDEADDGVTTPLLTSESRSLSATPVRQNIVSIDTMTRKTAYSESTLVTTGYANYKHMIEESDGCSTNEGTVKDTYTIKAKSTDNFLSSVVETRVKKGNALSEQDDSDRKTKSCDTVCIESTSPKSEKEGEQLSHC